MIGSYTPIESWAIIVAVVYLIVLTLITVTRGRR